jgi:acetyl-CoA/propionyl-CoA carboxylase, biotin carboxylase, biotin carboxyl carrier protein
VSNWYLVKDGDRNVRVAVAADDRATWVFVDGNVWRIEKEQDGGRRSKSRGDASVMAPMPATVVAINTAPGKTVNEGETVIVLEAMKMELPIKAPRGGVVTAVNCAMGELVQPGVNLVDLA